MATDHPDRAVFRLRMMMFSACGLILAYPDARDEIVDWLRQDKGRVIRDVARGYMVPAPDDWGWPNVREA
jgi:hypothetical protein